MTDTLSTASHINCQFIAVQSDTPSLPSHVTPTPLTATGHSAMARKSTLIPEVYYPPCPSDEEDDEMADDRGKEGLEEEQQEQDEASPVQHDFIPLLDLTLEQLPENLRSEENLQLIQNMGTRVVLIRTPQSSGQAPGRGQTASKQTGWGVLLALKKVLGRRVAFVVTTRHVLPNEAEVKRSRVEVCLDPRVPKVEGQGCLGAVSGRGMALMKGRPDDDLRVAVYVMADWVDSMDGPGDLEPLASGQPCSGSGGKGKDSERSGLKTVCVLALDHDMAKFVSFGSVLSADPEGKSVTHDALVLPEFPGAPMLVFPGGPSTSLWYHVGEDASGHKSARLLLPNFSSSAQNLAGGSSGQTAGASSATPSEMKGLQSFLQQFQEDFLRLTAAAAVDGDCLAAFLPVLAAFLLRPEAYIKTKQELQKKDPCSGNTVGMDAWTAREEADMREILLEISAAMPVLVPPRSVEEASDLVSLIKSRYPCRCRAIVRAVMEEGRGGAADGGIFLRPDVASKKVRPWPWSAQLSRDDAGELTSCLMEACLENCRLHSDRRLPLLLLVMLKNANEALHQKFGLLPDDDPDEGEILYTRKAPDSEPTDAATKETENPERNLEVACLLKNAASLVAADTKWLMTGSLVTMLQQASQRCSLTIPIISFAVGLDRMNHIAQHSAQERPGSKTQQLCRCGRPSFADLATATESIRHAFRELDGLKKGECAPPLSSVASPGAGSTLEGERTGLSRNKAVTACLDRAAEALAGTNVPAAKGAPQPGEVAARVEAFMRRLDELENFSQASDVLSRGATSCEAFLYNSCQFLRQCRLDVYPLWVATPVSVFGRPGNWPGHVTPDAVRKAVWKQVEMAFQQSDFGRQRLDFLRENKQSRDQLVDLYVDMKQHKFAGELDSSYFQSRVLRQVVSKQQQWSQAGLQCAQPRESVACHMVLSFASILNYPQF